MARIRAIHPRAPQDEDVASMSIWARYLWDRLPCYADREGRLEDRPLMLKGEVFPADNVDVSSFLKEFEDRKFIIRYQGSNGRRLIQIVSWHAYQRPDHREKISELPPPDGWGKDVCGKWAQNPGKTTNYETTVDNFPGKTTECNESSAIVSGRDRSGTPGSGIRLSGDPDLGSDYVSIQKPKRKPKTVGSEAFEEFWACYPAHRHVEKSEAIKSWPGDEALPAIKAALSWQTKSHDWTKEGGAFVPHPKRYLAKRRWEDEQPRQGILLGPVRDPSVGHYKAKSDQPIKTGRLEMP